MSFITYAKNQEDVFLYRAFKHLPAGFYVDIGAKDPREGSVTQAFYERGWRGINVEPGSFWYERLVMARHHDINLKVAVADKCGDRQFDDLFKGEPSAYDVSKAAMYQQRGYAIREINIETITLEALFDLRPLSDVHFLRINAVGSEEKVIRGGNWEKHRPWVILISSSISNCIQTDHQGWEPILTGHGYHFVWFDGINRFYVAEEHAELDRAFDIPINIFDQYVSDKEFNLRTESREMRLQLINLANLQRKLAEREDEVILLNQGIASLHKAHAERLTLRRILRAALNRSKAIVRRLGAKLVNALQARLQCHPVVQRNIVRWITSTPTLERFVRKIIGNTKPVPVSPVLTDPDSSGAKLSPVEAAIYWQIRES